MIMNARPSMSKKFPALILAKNKKYLAVLFISLMIYIGGEDSFGSGLCIPLIIQGSLC